MQSARGFEYGVVHLISPRSGFLFDILHHEVNLSAEASQELLDLGALYYQHQRIKENISVLEGDYIRVHTKPRRFPKNNFNWAERIIFQNPDFLVINKPAALPVHASVDNIQENLLSYLTDYLKMDLFVTHRLDVPTKGLIVLAKTISFQREFNKLLIARKVRKIYRALVLGQGPGEGLLTHYMEHSPRAPKNVSSQPHEGWQNCVLKVLSKRKISETQTELEIELHTGRTHQIRAQLSAEGFPLLGDTAYGAEKYYVQEEIGLTACELRFTYEDQALSFRLQN